MTKQRRHPPRYGRFPHEAFGARTLDDVRGTAFGLLRKKWPGKSLHDIEDAIGEAMLDLIELWQFMPSTRQALAEGDPEKCFSFAVRYLYGQCLTGFEQVRDRNIAHPVDAMVDTADEAMQYVGTVWQGAMHVLDGDEFSDEEREERMLALLLDRHGVDGLRENVERLNQ